MHKLDYSVFTGYVYTQADQENLELNGKTFGVRGSDSGPGTIPLYNCDDVTVTCVHNL